ncbi:MAG: helix-turn-helix domain-containing protein [Candidatus Binataceae bacterium]
MLQELIALIGEEAATRLIAAFGGTRLYVPHSPQDGDALTATIGLNAALKLACVYGGDRVDVPNPTPRRTRIIALRSTGLTVDAIARALGCTRRRVFQVLAEARDSKTARS